ncbi:MAG: hypothetical protein KY459_09245 [Acidobacteria bacterium]|nr:hypothetical protein [Acidobacteriota bacterium]
MPYVVSSISLLDEYVFFIDRGLGRKKFPGALRELGLNVEIHDDHFIQDADDTVWISYACGRGWVIISKDNRIRYRSLEKLAFTKAAGRGFFFTQGDQRAETMIDAFTKAVPRIARMLAKEEPPFMASISTAGNVALLKM